MVGGGAMFGGRWGDVWRMIGQCVEGGGVMCEVRVRCVVGCEVRGWWV